MFTGYHMTKLKSKLTKEELDFAIDFVKKHEKLGKVGFHKAVNKLLISGEYKTKNLLIIDELLSCYATRLK